MTFFIHRKDRLPSDHVVARYLANKMQRAGSFSETCPAKPMRFQYPYQRFYYPFPRISRVAPIWAPDRPQRGARTVGLIGDRIRDILQHPLRREHLPSQPLFQHRGLIQRFGQRLEDGFHDVVRVAAIHEIHVQVESAVRDEGLEEILEQA